MAKAISNSGVQFVGETE